jgi:hypothetical protein
MFILLFFYWVSFLYDITSFFFVLIVRYNRLRDKFPAASFSGRPILSEAGFDLLNRLLTYDPDKVQFLLSSWHLILWFLLSSCIPVWSHFFLLYSVYQQTTLWSTNGSLKFLCLNRRTSCQHSLLLMNLTGKFLTFSSTLAQCYVVLFHPAKIDFPNIIWKYTGVPNGIWRVLILWKSNVWKNCKGT